MAKFEMRIKMIATIQDLNDIMKHHSLFDQEDIIALKLKTFTLRQTYRFYSKAQKSLDYVKEALEKGPAFYFNPPQFTEAPNAIDANSLNKPIVTRMSGHEIKIKNEKLQISIDLLKMKSEDLLEEIESNLIIEVWYMCCFNMTMTSRKLGISTKGLYIKIRKIYEKRGLDFLLRDTDCGVRNFEARAYVTQLATSFLAPNRAFTGPEQISP